MLVHITRNVRLCETAIEAIQIYEPWLTFFAKHMQIRFSYDNQYTNTRRANWILCVYMGKLQHQLNRLSHCSDNPQHGRAGRNVNQMFREGKGTNLTTNMFPKRSSLEFYFPFKSVIFIHRDCNYERHAEIDAEALNGHGTRWEGE